MAILEISQLVSVPQEERLAKAYLQPICLAPGETPPWVEVTQSGRRSRGAIAFQYWPASIQDTRQTGWNPKPVPGGSHPIREWTGGGDRSFPMTVVFSTDMSPPFEISEHGLDLGGHHIDIRTAVSWLRWFTYPHYGSDGLQVAYPPPKALLVLPNMKMGHAGDDYLVVTVDQADITYQECFSDGTPKIAEVSVIFTESIHGERSARFHDRANFTPSMGISGYNLSVEGIDAG